MKILLEYIFWIISILQPKLGSASKIWLASLEYLNKQLDGQSDIILKGEDCKLDQLIDFFDVKEISWNRSYEHGSSKEIKISNHVFKT